MKSLGIFRIFRALAIGSALLSALSCNGANTKKPAGENAESDAGTSPNASILPAPLMSEAPEPVSDAGPPEPPSDAGFQGILADSAGRLILPDAGPPPPESLRGDMALAPEPSPPPKDVAGLSLEMVWRWRDMPSPPKAPEVSAEGIKEAQKLTSLSWKVDLADTGRMRIEFGSRALPFAMRTEIRARADRYGHVLVWPNLAGFRVIPPGALRTALGELRVDVTPLSAGTLKPQGEGKRLGVATRKLELSSSIATLKLEMGKVSEAGEGGTLLCRALVELAGIDPKSPVCQAGEVVLLANYSWSGGGGVGLEVLSLNKRSDLTANEMLMPPPGVPYQATGLPIAPDGIFVTREELKAFRNAAIAPSGNADPLAPGEGFMAANWSEMLMYLLLDGVPVAAVPAGKERYLIGTQRGRYSVQWRTFLGEKVMPAQVVEFPAKISYGAGAADAGVDSGAPQ